MRAVDPQRPGARLEVTGPAEIDELVRVFNQMLDRLERERQDSARHQLEAQEGERKRIAHELHDEVGQLLTGVLAQLEALVQQTPSERASDVRRVQETARQAIEVLSRVVRDLRPEALDELGLANALEALASRVEQQGGLIVNRRIDDRVSDLGPERELVVYRVAQEALTNALRHSRASTIALTLEPRDTHVVLSVRDDGIGLPTDHRVRHGILGMRERSMLIGQADGGGLKPGGRGHPRCSAGMTEQTVTRVLLADDHHVVRHGLRMLLDAQPDLAVVAEAGDGLEAVQLSTTAEFELAILDVSMPRMTGIHAAAEIHRRRPDVSILMLSMHDNEQFLLESLRAGASGYVLKSAVDRDLIEACRATIRGEPVLYPSAIRALIRHLEAEPADAKPILTPRETEVVKLIAEAYNTKEIAQMLVISPRTVERHRANILEKLGMKDRVQLTRYAIRQKLIEP